MYKQRYECTSYILDYHDNLIIKTLENTYHYPIFLVVKGSSVLSDFPISHIKYLNIELYPADSKT